MSEVIWALEVRVGDTWMVRQHAFTKEKLLEQADIYAGRALESGTDVRVAPYVLDLDRIEMLEIKTRKKV